MGMRVKVGDEVTLQLWPNGVKRDVVVLDKRVRVGSYAHGNCLVRTESTEVYVEHENGGCEWVLKRFLKPFRDASEAV